MEDVAALAGVSGQTVSRVVNNRKNVDPETRDRVLRAMNMIGYRTNTAARALATGQFRAIGVINFNLRGYGESRVLESLAAAARPAGYHIDLMEVGVPTEEAVREAYGELAVQAVDGVVLIQAQLLDTPTLHLPTGIPVVIVAGDRHQRYAVVDTDQAAGARLATEHLLSLGHRTVWHLAGPQDSPSARQRLEAWHNTLKEAGSPVPPVSYGDWTADSGYEAGQRLAQEPDLTAVFTANDQMALGVMLALAEAGRSVPGDVSVVGFDDVDDSSCYQPPLTTVHQEFERVGEQCLASLLHQMSHGQDTTPPVSQILPRLVVRKSTAAPAK
ncbi:LacI family DNA-binding transcriptional regulator [Streptomyces sp. NPDC006458]|uniref:LacI family DNA-binding transcriptional regulator n=1 Tax=Streptomyces sp. NPDC006458 TaxID=3154302 RepID=UPI0033AA940F